MKKVTLTIVLLFVTMLAFSNVFNEKRNTKGNEVIITTNNYKIDEKSKNSFCSYTMTSSYRGGPSFTATIYCNEGDDEAAQQEFVRSVALMYYYMFQF